MKMLTLSRRTGLNVMFQCKGIVKGRWTDDLGYVRLIETQILNLYRRSLLSLLPISKCTLVHNLGTVADKRMVISDVRSAYQYVSRRASLHRLSLTLTFTLITLTDNHRRSVFVFKFHCHNFGFICFVALSCKISMSTKNLIYHENWYMESNALCLLCSVWACLIRIFA